MRRHRVRALGAAIAGRCRRTPAGEPRRRERYLGAGPPWYLTLFGRDSLISAGMLIPVDPQLAAGTSRALAAAGKGPTSTPTTAEQPGKIPHELRAEVADHGGGLVLPAGLLRHSRRDPAVDHHAPQGLALGHARRRGPGAAAEPPESAHLDAGTTRTRTATASSSTSTSPATAWPTRAGRTPTTRCSGRTARSPRRPIALCEVQGYAYAAAIAGAELLTAFGLEGADEWRRVGRRTSESASASTFWVDGYPAIALDGDEATRRRTGVQHGPPARHRASSTERRRPRSPTSGRSADLDSGFGLQNVVHGNDPVQSARLPHRQRLAARHRDGGPGPVRRRPGRGRDVVRATACSMPPKRSTTGCRSCTAEAAARRRARRRRTRCRAGRRPGQPPRRSRWLSPRWGSHRTCRTDTLDITRPRDALEVPAGVRLRLGRQLSLELTDGELTVRTHGELHRERRLDDLELMSSVQDALRAATDGDASGRCRRPGTAATVRRPRCERKRRPTASAPTA